MKGFNSLIFALSVASVLQAQTVYRTDNGVKFSTPEPVLNGEIQFYSPTIVRVVKYPSAEMPEKKSYPVVMEPHKTEFSYKQDGNIVFLSSENIIVELDLMTGKVEYNDKNGKLILSEKPYGTNFAGRKDVDKDSYTVSQAFMLEPEEVIYGLGQRQQGVMNHRNQKIELRNVNTNICIPYFTSEKGYGVYWDNPGLSEFNDTPYETSFTSQVGLCSDYYFMYEDGTMDGVLSSLRDLTGKATMFPLWTMGYWQCRERYKSSDELCDILDKYRELKVPLDGIVQDWQYWGCDSNWNAMRFMNPRYINKVGDKEWMKYIPGGFNGDEAGSVKIEPRIKSPQQMVDHVHKQNAHLMISIWASFGPWTDQYKELKNMNALIPIDTWPHKSGAAPYDPFNEKARDLYWKYLTHMYDMGFDAWWTDSTEPDHFNIKDKDYDFMTADGSYRSVYNAFPLLTNKGIYEHQRAVSDDKRLFLMTRSSYLGQHHYGSFSWSGDVVSSWRTMKQQIPAGLNYMLCGIPFWTTDLAGFFGWEYNNDWNNVAYQELHVRWFQWGCFQPMMRNHCSSPMMNEIWLFGKEGDWAYDAQKRIIELRYRLLPYIYSTAGECVHNDGVMMRPLVMDFAADRRAILLDDEYLFGRNILACPVTEPLYTKKVEKNKGVTTVEDVATASKPYKVYLPKGTKWIDFWTNEVLDGGQDVNRECPISIMPVYIKAGSILPLGPDVQYSTEKKWDNLDICIYPGADGEFTLYEDEFDNYNYEKGMFSTIKFMWNDKERKLTILDRKGEYPNMLKKRSFNITVMEIGKPSAEKKIVKTDKKVRYNGQKTEILF